MIMDKLYKEALNIGPVCVGLDTRIEYFPEYLKNKNISISEKIHEFNKKIIDNTLDLAACYKVQIACYEALGMEGLKAYSQTLKYIRSKGKVVIADIKRGDISSTAGMYAKAHFEGDFEADIITVNAYMGEDAISPYYKYLDKKGLFILLRTSNPSSKDFQDLLIDNKEMFYHVGEKTDQWGKNFMGESGFSAIGAVVGITYPKEFEKIQSIIPNTFFLVPGYGAQGGTGKDIATILKKSRCAVVNSSRGLITAHKNICEDENFALEVRKKTFQMKEDLLKWLR